MSDNTMRMLIRANAGPGTGVGHVMRCLALAQSWGQMGHEVAFVTGDIPGGLTRRIQKEGFRTYTITNDRCDAADARDTSEIANAFRPNWIVLDGYKFDDTYQDQLSLLRSKLLVVDDFGHGVHTRADLVLNQNVYAETSLYQRRNTKSEFLLGSNFLLLRNEFRNAENNAPKTIRSNARRLLVTFGGEDANNFTLESLKAIADTSAKDIIVDVVVGSANRHHESLATFKRNSTLNIRIHRNVDRMSHLFEGIDLAITAAGSTTYELAHSGIPMIMVAIAENQIAVGERLDDQGIGAFAGYVDEIDFEAFAKLIRRVRRDVEWRKEMSTLGKENFDGAGANRIARRLVSSHYQFRKATSRDAELLLRWRNDPEVRAVSFDDRPINEQNHRNWLTQKTNSRESCIWIIESEAGEPQGQVRMDLESDRQQARISISIVPGLRGRGLGAVFIEKACRLAQLEFNVQRIVAQIKPGNVASHSAFRKSGFKLIAPTTINGNLAHQMMLELEPQTELQIRKSA